jgi:hypothetical protein
LKRRVVLRGHCKIKLIFAFFLKLSIGFSESIYYK